jgi:hypothetical protein
MFGFDATRRLVSVGLQVAVLLVAVWASLTPASAQSPAPFLFTAPAAGTIGPSGNVSIQWTGGDPGQPVSLFLIDFSAWQSLGPIASGIPNSGSFNWAIPPSLPCGRDYEFYVFQGQGGAQPGPAWAYGPPFTLLCPHGGSDAVVADVKTVTNNTPADLTGWHYPVTVTCNGVIVSTQSMAENAPQYVSGGGVPLGATCTIAEILPLPLPEAPKGEKLCPEGMTLQWLAPSYTPGQNTVAAALPEMVTIHNTLTCVGEPPRRGELTVVKTVTNPYGADFSGIAFPMQVQCGPTSTTTNYTANFNLSAANSWQRTVSPITLGNTCSVIESGNLALPSDTGKCVKPNVLVWVQPPTFTPPSVVVNGPGAVITANNVLDCVKSPPPGDTVTVTKLVQNNTGADLSQLVYPISVWCDGGPQANFSLADGQSGVVNNVPFGMDCKVGEDPQQLPVPEKACPDGTTPHWTVTVPNDYVHAGDTATVTNVFDCVKAGDGSLELVKRVINNTGGVVPNWYLAVLQCIGMADQQVVLTIGQPLLVSGLPLGATCHVVEDWQNLPLPASPRACPPGTFPQWRPAVYSPVNVTAGGQPATLTATNEIDCVGEGGGGGVLNFVKHVTYPGPVTLPPGTQYFVHVYCEDGFDQVLALTDGGTATVSNAPLGVDCKVEELAPMPDVSAVKGLCPEGTHPEWLDATFAPPPPFPVRDDPTTVEVHNTLICQKDVVGTGSLTIDKSIFNDGLDITGAQAGDFQVEVSCTNPASTQTLVLMQSNGYQAQVPGLPVGALCTITELLPQMPTVLPPGSQWAVTYPAGQQVTIQAGNQTLPLSNEWVRNTVGPDQSELRVTKDFAIHGELDPNHTMTFQVSVTCIDANGVPVSGFNPLPVSLTPNFVSYLNGGVPEANYSAWATLAAPVGSICTISEGSLPPLSANLSACQWATGTPVYSNYGYGGSEQPGASITLGVAQQTYELSVLNELNCPPFIVAPEPEPNCKKGLVRVDGNCVKPKPKPVEKPVICKKGLVLVDGECVKPAKACKAPYVSNGKGGCVCAPGMKETENGCALPGDLLNLKLPKGLGDLSFGG